MVSDICGLINEALRLFFEDECEELTCDFLSGCHIPDFNGDTVAISRLVGQVSYLLFRCGFFFRFDYVTRL